MCGIAGFVTDAPLADDADRVLAGMLAPIAYRGPDGPGQRVDRDGRVALGHVRLAINDLSPTGAQPLVSADRALVVTVAGEIYGFQPRRAELTAAGERFESKSDSELVLALYRRHGLAFVDHLRGEFAIALFDRARQRVVLVRDRFGVRPLVYHATPRLVAWGSEAKAVLAHPAVPRRLSPTAAVHQLAQVMVPGTTAFADVAAVRPGHMVVIERGARGLEVSARRYWDLRFPTAAARVDRGPAAHVDAVRAAVVDALAVRAEADVPVGLYLSGGMDSGALLGLACALRQAPPRAFTLGFEDPAYDESAIAARVAAAHGVAPIRRLITDADLYGAHYVRAVVHSERTFYNTLGVAKLHLSAATRAAGVRAVISGEGADELFAGYPAFALDGGPAADGGRIEPLFVGAIVAAQPERHPAFDRRCGFTPAWIHPWISTWRRARGLLADRLAAELADYDPIAEVAGAIDADAVGDRHPLDVAQYTWIKIMLDGQILSWGGDRVDMANAVESRPVFLDHQLAEVAVAVPPAYRIRDGVEKWVLREALRGVLPAFLYERRKFAFMAPPAHRSPARAAAVRALTDRYLSPAALERVGVCDPGRTRRFLDQLADPRDPATANEDDKLCNHLLGLHILHEHFIA